MKYWGINALNHGSSIAVFNDNIYTQYTYNSDTLSIGEIHDLFRKHGEPDRIFWYERPWIKKARQLYAGQYKTAFDTSTIPRIHLAKCDLAHIPVTYTSHHASHAAAGYYTSPYDECAVIVLDAIGEFESATIWHGSNNQLKKVWSRSYPNSLGLFYSAFTHLCGLTPVQDEGKLEKLSAEGDPKQYYDTVKDYIGGDLILTRNLHRGVRDWPYEIKDEQDIKDIAAAVQRVFEEEISGIVGLARWFINSDNLVFMGGCAMNRGARKMIDYAKVWTLPNPGDPSSSIGAVAYHTKQKLKEQK
jgi:carbamoyltransferase